MPKSLKNLMLLYNKDIDYYASSLSFFGLFAFLPVVTLMIYATSLLSGGKSLEGLILGVIAEVFPSTNDLQMPIKEFLQINAKVSSLSLLYICVVSFLFLKDYKIIVGKILKTSMDFKHDVAFYITHIFVAPLLIFAYTYLYQITESYLIYNPLALVIFGIFYTLGIVTTKHAIKPWLILGISLVGSLAWEMLKNLYIYYITYNQIYTSLYGSLAAVFFLLLWIYLSWIIFLCGFRYYHKAL